MIINPIAQPEEFRLELRVLSAYISGLAKLARQSYESRVELTNLHCRSLAFLGHDFKPSTGSGSEVVIGPLVSAVSSAAELICKAHIKACGDFSIPFSIDSFLREKLKREKDFCSNGGAGKSAVESALDYFEGFCFESVFYNELAEQVTPESGQDMAYAKAANGLISSLPWYQVASKRSEVVFSKSSYSEPQWGKSAGALRLAYSVESDLRDLAGHLAAFEKFSDNSDLKLAFQLLNNHLFRNGSGYNLRDTIEFGAVKIVFFKSKIEFRMPHDIFGQLVAFCRLYGDEYQVRNRLEPNLDKAVP